MTEFGILGLLVLAGFLGWFLWRGIQAYRRAPADQKPVVLSLVIAHAGMFTLSMGIEAFYTRPWWLVFALIACAYCIASRPQIFVESPSPAGGGRLSSQGAFHND